MSQQLPSPFLETRVSFLTPPPPLTALCAGYDAQRWRAAELGEHLFNWVPYVGLSQESQNGFAAHNFMELLKVAAAHIYTSKKTQSRGELGELMLHLACVLHFRTLPVVCKLVLKTSANDTVKGFDGVHIVAVADGVELWLGESKFYENGRQAVRDAVSSIREHIAPEFLAAEKAMLVGHVPLSLPGREHVLRAFHSHTTRDELLRRSVFPVLIAYESAAVQAHKEVVAEYLRALHDEVASLKDYFLERSEGLSLRVQLIFIPLELKSLVVESFDRKLRAFL